jgi:hypothetical protein
VSRSAQQKTKGKQMAKKPNYGFEKRQKELARKSKKEDKKRKREPEEENAEPSAEPETSE